MTLTHLKILFRAQVTSLVQYKESRHLDPVRAAHLVEEVSINIQQAFPSIDFSKKFAMRTGHITSTHAKEEVFFPYQLGCFEPQTL